MNNSDPAKVPETWIEIYESNGFFWRRMTARGERVPRLIQFETYEEAEADAKSLVPGVPIRRM